MDLALEKIAMDLKRKSMAGQGERRWIPNSEIADLLEGVRRDELAERIRPPPPQYLPGTEGGRRQTTFARYNRA